MPKRISFSSIVNLVLKNHNLEYKNVYNNIKLQVLKTLTRVY